MMWDLINISSRNVLDYFRVDCAVKLFDFAIIYYIKNNFEIKQEISYFINIYTDM